MKNNEYALTCTSCWGDTEVFDKYPVLNNYHTRIEYPYRNPGAPRIVIEVDDLRKFYNDIGKEIIICKDVCDDSVYALEIYDDYRE